METWHDIWRHDDHRAVADVYIWWGIECDEFEWYLIGDKQNAVWQILWIKRAKHGFSVLAWDGDTVEMMDIHGLQSLWKMPLQLNS